MSSERMYECPACGQSSTVVIQTISYPSCVIRKRKCMLCGELHETTEIPM